MKDKSFKIYSIVFIFFGLAVSLIPRWLVPVCAVKDNKPMRCYYSANIVVCLGIAMAILALIYFFVGRYTSKHVFYLMVNLLFGLGMILVPNQIIGGCKSEMMPCRMLTYPTLYFVGSIIIIFGLICLMIEIRKRERNNREQ